MASTTDTLGAADHGRGADLRRSVVRIRGPDGQVRGTGFAVRDDMIVTCAHVVAADQAPPAHPVAVEFPHGSPTAFQALVDAERWRSPEREDVAFLRVDQPLTGSLRPLLLGRSEGAVGHRVVSFGFPTNAPSDGHYGFGRVGGEVRGDGGSRLLQITEAWELTEGFSGAPVLDEATGLVIGLVDSVATVDRLGRGGTTVYVTPSETLRAVSPELAVSVICPYVGLAAFTVEHADWFFGRERAVAAVVARLRHDSRMVALLGPSGSGKSSLVNAGVLPALSRGALPGSERWAAVSVLPADMPDEPLAVIANRSLAADPEHSRVVLVLDQFEQLLVTTDAYRRSAVLAELAELPDLEPAVTVLLVMRDDFYGRLAAGAPSLMRRLERSVVNIPAVLERKELAAIVDGPAAAVGLSLEPQLTDRIVDDAVEAAPPGMPGVGGAATTVLPLVEFTLTELWRRRADGQLTHAAYHSLGGVTGGLVDWCERTYRSLPAALRPVAQRTLTALVEPADDATGTPPVRRRRSEVDLGGDATRATRAAPEAEAAPPVGVVDEVLVRLADARLIVSRQDPATGQATVELIHDALIREWARLREWVEEDREFLAWYSRVEDECDAWCNTGDNPVSRDSDLLLRGSALEQAIRWCTTRHVRADINDFVERSGIAEERRRVRHRRGIQVLASLLIVALALGVTAVAYALRAEQHARIAASRALAVQANTLLADQPEVAHLLALESLRAAPTDLALASLQAALSRGVNLAQPLTGHDGAVRAVAFSRRGALASAGADGTVRVWDPVTGEQVVAPFTGHAGAVNGVAFGPDGTVLASGGADGVVQLWDLESGEQLTDPLTGHQGSVRAVAFSLDGTVLASSGADGTVRLWDPHAGEPIRDPLTGHDGRVEDVAFHPDGRVLASAGWDDTVRLWDLETGEQFEDPLTGHDFPVDGVAFRPDGRVLASGGADGTVRLWDRKGEQIGRPLSGHTEIVVDLAFSANGMLASASLDGTVRLWDLAAREQVGDVLRHDGAVRAVAFSPDDGLLASASDDGALRLWDLTADRRLGHDLSDHDSAVRAVAFSPEGGLLASGSDDGTVRLWDPGTRKPVGSPLRGHDGAVLGVAFSPEGGLLASAGRDGAVRLWDPGTRQPVGDPLRHEDAVRAVAFSPQGGLLASATVAGTVELWDPGTQEPVGGPLRGHDGAVLGVAFSPEGGLLASAGRDGTVRLWDPGTWEPVGGPLHHEGLVLGVAFSPVGGLLASAGRDGTVRLWDPGTGQPVSGPLRGHDGAVLGVAFSPEGDLLASAGRDRTVRLWGSATRRQIGESLTGHDRSVQAVAFRPGGGLLASAGTDHTVRLWATPETWIAHACQRVTRNLSKDLWETYLGESEYVRTCADYPAGPGASSTATAGRLPELPDDYLRP